MTKDKRNFLALIIFAILAALIGAYLLFGNDAAAPNLADGGATTPQLQAADPDVEETQDERREHRTGPEKVSPQAGDSIATPETGPDVSLVWDERKGRIAFELNPTFKGHYQPAILALIDSVEVEAYRDEAREEFLYFSDIGSPIARAKRLVTSLVGAFDAEIFVTLRISFNVASIERTFDKPTRNAAGEWDLGVIDLVLENLDLEDAALIRGELQHRSGVSQSLLPEIQLRLDSDTVALEAFSRVFLVKCDPQGVFWVLLSRRPLAENVARVLSDAEIMASYLKPHVGGDPLRFREQHGKVFDFGRGTISGAVVTFSLKVNLSPPFAWQGSANADNAEAVLAPQGYDSVIFSLQSMEERAKVSGEHIGGGIFQARVLVAAETLAALAYVEMFGSKLSISLRSPDVLELLDGDQREVNFTLDAPPLDIVLVEVPPDYEGSLVFGYTYPKNDPESFQRLQKAQTWPAFDALSSYEYLDGKILYMPTQLDNLVLYVAGVEYKAVFLPLSERTPPITRLSLKERWQEGEEADEKTTEVKVRVERNGKKISNEASLSVALFAFGSTDYTENFRFGEAESAEIVFKEVNPGNEYTFLVIDPEGSWGFAEALLTEPVEVRVEAGMKEVVLKLRSDVLYDGPITGAKNMRFVCKGHDVEYGYFEADPGSEKYPTEDLMSSYLRGEWRNRKVKRISPTLFEYELPALAYVSISATYLQKYPEVVIESERLYYRITKPGTYPVPYRDASDGGEQFLVSCAYRMTKIPLFRGWSTYEENGIVTHNLDIAPTLVEIEGKSGDYTWTLVPLDGEAGSTDALVAGVVVALMPGEYQWRTERNIRYAAIYNNVVIPDSAAIKLRIPLEDAKSNSGQLHFSITEEQRNSLLGSGLKAGIAASLPEGRVPLSTHRDSYETRTGNSNFSVRLEGFRVVVSDLPSTFQIILQFTMNNGDSIYASEPQLYRVGAVATEGKPAPLPEFFPSAGYPYYPTLSGEQFKSGLIDIDDNDRGLLVEIYRDGKLLRNGLGMAPGVRYEVRVFVAAENSEQPAAIFYCRHQESGVQWDEGTIAALQPIIQRIPGFVAKDHSDEYE